MVRHSVRVQKLPRKSIIRDREDRAFGAGEVKGRDLGLLLLLGAMWGSSFLFIKVAVGDVDPAFIVGCRLFFAVLTLLAVLPILTRSTESGEGRILVQAARLWRPMLVLGASNAVVPYFVISWGTQFMPSGTAAILNSTVPLFTAVLAGMLPFFANERLGASGIAGILLGILGVGILVDGLGGGFSGSATEAFLGAGAVMTGSLSYAIGGLYARRRMKGVPVAVSAVGQNAAGFLVMLPFAAFYLPAGVPGLPVIGSLVGLGAIGTGLSLLIYFRLIASVGATRTSTVTYLVPIWALVYGALLLGEDISARSLLGLALILLGISGVSGIVRLPRRRPPAAP